MMTIRPMLKIFDKTFTTPKKGSFWPVVKVCRSALKSLRFLSFRGPGESFSESFELSRLFNGLAIFVLGLDPPNFHFDFPYRCPRESFAAQNENMTPKPGAPDLENRKPTGDFAGFRYSPRTVLRLAAP